jgi:predicted O-linked N-acetylglucosamine transferase (SPINDLY family)
MSTSAELLADARRHYQEHRYDLAIQTLQMLLCVDPGIPEAHNNLGIVLARQGRLHEAVRSFQEAARLRPDYAEAHNNLGNALREQGRPEAALEHLREAIRLRPDFLDARNNLAIALRALDESAEAGSSLPATEIHRTRRSTAVDRFALAQAEFHQGYALAQEGRYEEAAARYRQGLLHLPGSAGAHNDLGSLLCLQGGFSAAIDSFRQAIRCQPDLATAHNNLGSALRILGHNKEAIASSLEAVRLEPNFAEAHNNLGIACQETGQLVQGEMALRRALEIRPDYTDASYNLSTVLWKQGKWAESIHQCQHVLRLKADHVGAYLNLGNIYRGQSQVDDAVAAYRAALSFKPDYVEAHANLGNIFRDRGQADEALKAYRIALGLKPQAADIRSNLIFLLNYHPGFDARAIREECDRWDQQHALPLKPLIQPHTNQIDPERRLRIGYVSPDFHQHPCSHFTVPLLSSHDHSQFEVFCYAELISPDAISARLRSCADVWRTTVGLSDQELADMVRGDQIDILVDLAMHTANNRLLMFARKPAPVQVAWLAYPGTTGLKTMDYRLTDPYLDPPGLFDEFYSEESVRLPETFWCYDPLADGPPVNSLPAEASGVVTFGCFNNFCKVNEGCLALWAEVLRKVRRSRLLLAAPRGQSREHVLARLRSEGIREGCIEFVDRLSRPDYLRLHHRIDLCLDPVPCNGGTTTCDALWMGIPTIALVGKTVVGRAGWSILNNVGLGEFAAQRADEYLAIATQWANDLPGLGHLRRTLRARLQQSPLMDAQRFARRVEQAYRQMWRRWCHANDG